MILVPVLVAVSACAPEDGSDASGDCGPGESCQAAIVSLDKDAIIIGDGPVVTIGGEPADEGTTNEKASFTFTSPTARRFLCSRDGAAFTACVSPQVYGFPRDGSADGLHTFRVRGFDQFGRGGPIATRTFVFDSAAPIALITSADPPDGSASRNPNWTLTFTANDTSATFECLENGITLVRPCFSGTAIFQGFDGLRTAAVRAVDALGNVGPFSNTVSYRLDTRGPNLINIVKPPTSNHGPRGIVTVSWSADEPVASYVCTFPNVSTIVPCAGGVAMVQEGFSTNFLDVIATDLLGNVSSTSITWVVN